MKLSSLRPYLLSGLMALIFFACSPKFAGEWVPSIDEQPSIYPAEVEVPVFDFKKDGELMIYVEESQRGTWESVDKGDLLELTALGETLQLKILSRDKDHFRARVMGEEEEILNFTRKEAFIENSQDPKKAVEAAVAGTSLEGLLNMSALKVEGDEAHIQQTTDVTEYRIVLKRESRNFADGDEFTTWQVRHILTNLPPKEVGRRFLIALGENNYNEAKLYSGETTRLTLDALQELADAMGGGGGQEGGKLEFGRFDQDGDKGTLHYTEDGEASSLNLVKEEGAWVVSWSKMGEDELIEDPVEEH